jgi:hypothetical protein
MTGGSAGVSEDRVQELLDREAIKEVKARYYRLMDERDWDGWRQLFTDDFRADLLGGQYVIEGPDAFLQQTLAVLGEARSAHYGHMPEIAFDSPTEARAVWAAIDYLEWPSDPETGERNGSISYGHERETYRKIDGEWKIASYDLRYLRQDPVLRQPLPERQIPNS